jgi:hypothetical protein
VAASRSVASSPEGPSDTNGGDRINAHVSGRFLRALRCPGLSFGPVTPLLLIGLGLAALGVGIGALLSFGSRYRIGRLLAASRAVSIGEALEMAASSEPRYVRIQGRIDSDREFEDADHRPLVLRRTRLEARTGSPVGRWRAFDERLDVVPFQLDEGLDTIAIDVGSLDQGLVVVPRSSVGVAADLGDRAPTGMGPQTPVRVTVELVSSVEHAMVLGTPTLDDAGAAVMRGGLGRPLVLTTLEIPEAMRVLTGGDVRRSRLAAAFLVGGLALLIAGGGWLVLGSWLAPLTALAASAAPSILPGSDTRSSGEGPGLVGDPGLAIAGVIGIAVVAVLASLAYVRLTANRRVG